MSRAIATISLCLLCTVGFALPITLKFRITDDANNVLKGMTVRLYEKNELVEEVQNSRSTVEFQLTEASIYTVEVVLNGFVTKRIAIITEMIEGPIDDDVFRFHVSMERSVDYRGVTDADEVLDFPSAVVDYDTNSGLFDYNETYLISTEKAFRELYEKQQEIEF